VTVDGRVVETNDDTSGPRGRVVRCIRLEIDFGGSFLEGSAAKASASLSDECELQSEAGVTLSSTCCYSTTNNRACQWTRMLWFSGFAPLSVCMHAGSRRGQRRRGGATGGAAAAATAAARATRGRGGVNRPGDHDRGPAGATISWDKPIGVKKAMDDGTSQFIPPPTHVHKKGYRLAGSDEFDTSSPCGKRCC